MAFLLGGLDDKKFLGRRGKSRQVPKLSIFVDVEPPLVVAVGGVSL